MARQQELTADTLWAEVSDRLKGALNDTTFGTWFGDVSARELNERAFVLSVPNDFTRDWIEGHFLDLIGAAVRDATGDERQISLFVEREVEPSGPIEDAPAQTARRAFEMSQKYTFDSFVIGSSNRFAHAAALAVAEAPAQAYNPLFIYGGTGLGKTHLLQAIGAVRRRPFARALGALHHERDVHERLHQLAPRQADRGLQAALPHVDLLLIDDIQFLEHKERIQEEFFHTFNSLYEAGRQIVISSDRPPREISTLEERLRSRFEWGLITDIQPPDLETRIAILRKKVKTDGIHVPDPQVLTFIAGRVSTNIRELEGALTRVVAFSSLTARPMTVELAQDVLKDVFPQGEAPEVSIERIQTAVSDRFGLSMEELCGDRRSQNIVYPRQVAMYLSRELTDASLPKIGREFGGRDHTTVIHATSKIARMIREDRSVYNLVQELTARVKQTR